MTTLWLSPLPDGCQLCAAPYESVMYDARTPFGWANICHQCFDENHCATGTGFGQRYELRPYGEHMAWVKTKG